MKNKWLYFYIILGCILLINCFVVSCISNFNIGTLFPGMLGTVLIIYGVCFEKLKKWAKIGFGKYFMLIAKTGFWVWFLSFLVITSTIVKNASYIAPKGADAMIVLGSGLKGSEVTKTLANRLDKAIEYYNNAESKPIIVVSGGQGSNELVPEAFAMKQYLIKNNIPENMIIEENQSHNTRQNFQYSKVLLDSYFSSSSYSIVYVTNHFHTFRAGLLAKKMGFEGFGAGAKSPPVMIANYYFREYFSMLKYFALDHFS